MAKRGLEHDPVPIDSSPLARQSKHSIPVISNVSLFHDAIYNVVDKRVALLLHQGALKNDVYGTTVLFRMKFQSTAFGPFCATDTQVPSRHCVLLGLASRAG